MLEKELCKQLNVSQSFTTCVVIFILINKILKILVRKFNKSARVVSSRSMIWCNIVNKFSYIWWKFNFRRLFRNSWRRGNVDEERIVEVCFEEPLTTVLVLTGFTDGNSVVDVYGASVSNSLNISLNIKSSSTFTSSCLAQLTNVPSIVDCEHRVGSCWLEFV